MSTKRKKIPKNPSNEEISSRYHANDDVETSKQFEALDREIDDFLGSSKTEMRSNSRVTAKSRAATKTGTDKSASQDRPHAEPETTKRMALNFLPSFQDSAKARAAEVGMDTTEYFRRAVFLAQVHPELLRTEEVERKEEEYREKLGPSRHYKA